MSFVDEVGGGRAHRLSRNQARTPCDARVFGASRNGGNIDVLLGNGDGTFRALSVSNTEQGFGSLTSTVVADFDGDGIPEAVVNDYFETGGNDLYFFAGNGSGSSAAVPTPISLNAQVSTNPYRIAAGDFSGDGKLDLAVTGGNGTTVFHCQATMLNKATLGVWKLRRLAPRHGFEPRT